MSVETSARRSVFVGIMVIWLLKPTHAEELCTPGGRQIFQWQYDSQATRLYTKWYWNDSIIMGKLPSGKIEIISNTQFTDRISEYKGTNCGLIVEDVRINDTGTFKVEVEFDKPPNYVEEENLIVTEDGLSKEILSNTEILINDTVYNVSEDNYLGEAPLKFTASLIQACIPAPLIEISSNVTEAKRCTDAYSCSETFDKRAALKVTIIVGTNHVPYQPGGKPFIIGENVMSSSDLLCRERIECIVPATVVPIGLVLLSATTALVILKPCSE